MIFLVTFFIIYFLLLAGVRIRRAMVRAKSIVSGAEELLAEQAENRAAELPYYTY